MSTHISCNKDDISNLVIMPGDPLRAKYIKENFLTDAKLINTTRNMFGYTGYYKNKRITVFAHGMGCPSVGIYSYELYKFYNVEKIIRIGTCGSLSKDVHVKDVILAKDAYSISNFDYPIFKKHNNYYNSSKDINNKILDTSKELNLNIKYGDIYTSDIFDVYYDISDILKSIDKNLLVAEMEAFGLFAIAKSLNKEASCILTVVDSKYEDIEISSEDREKSLNEMIKLALESIIKD